MARPNINVLDVLAQVQHEQNAILEDIREINNPNLLKAIEQDENAELQEILNDIAAKSTEFSQNLSEIHENVKRTEIVKERGSTK